jgi:hypothetical protein
LPYMIVYAGFRWPATMLENALEGYKINQYLQPFDIKSVAADIYIDPFLKRSAIAQETANNRIKKEEQERIRADIRDRSGYSDTYIDRFSIEIEAFYLQSFLLPAYILQYPNLPPRILPAISKNDTKVYGLAPLSVPKLVAAGTATSLVIATLFPNVAISFRLAFIALSAASSAFWASYGRATQFYFQKHKLEREERDNETVSETIADKNRFEETARDFLQSNQLFDLSDDFYQIMGLDPCQPVTEEIVRQAFNQKIKEVHPDHHGKTDETRQLLEARQAFLSGLRSKEQKNDLGRRHFSTMVARKVKFKEPPRSVFDPNADLLINAVLKEKNYKKAELLVKTSVVHPDGHNAGENTLLTEAAKRNDISAMEFALTRLKCSANTSCDCPHFNSAIHYVARYGSRPAIELLLKHGAEINLINSLGETPLDIAHSYGNEAAKQVLLEYGAIQHRNKSLSVKFYSYFFGYGPKDRTLLIDKEKVIQLPTFSGKK